MAGPVSDSPSADAARVSESLEAARRILVLTGAGVSAESGIPVPGAGRLVA